MTSELNQDKLRVLIVEDEIAIRTGLTDVLTYHGYAVEQAADGETGLQLALSETFDLVLLDLMLPNRDGFSVCEAIRERKPDQPIIMLTARVSDDDIVRGLRLGADDYVAKPFSVEQLVLRIGAVLRRSRPQQAGLKEIELADRTIDVSNLTCSEQEHYTKREMEVLVYLAQHHERAVPREELLHRVWGYDPSALIETRTVDIHIAKLRKKIEQDPKKPRALTTVRGAGYRLRLRP